MTGRHVYEEFGIRITKLLVPELISRMRTSIAHGTAFTVSYANFQTINIVCSSAAAREAFASLDLVTPDGGALPWALRRLGAPFHREHSLSAEFTMPALYPEAVREGWSFFLLGSDPGVAARAAGRLRDAFPSISVVGTHHGLLQSEAERQRVLEEIQRLKPNILLVGMGQPKQEEWIVKNRSAVGQAVLIGVGGYLEKLSHRITGYPAWVYYTRLFWLYRLATEPQRVWRRYTLGFVVFAAHVWRAKRAGVPARKLG